jgi:tRNA dimethylallyltransferase
VVCFWLDLPRAQLYERINARVEAMFENGLVEEVERLRRQPMSREARQALGYREVFGYLDGKYTLEETRELIQTHSRQFAKRQLTWFRQLPACVPATPEEVLSAWT